MLEINTGKICPPLSCGKNKEVQQTPLLENKKVKQRVNINTSHKANQII